MDTLQVCGHNIIFSQDTLRYFYSSVFQGFAALFSLGGMFYIYFSQSMTNRLQDLRERVRQHVRHLIGATGGEHMVLIDRNPIEYIENHVDVEKSKDGAWLTVFSLALEYRTQQRQVSEFKKYMYWLLPLSTVILVMSLFGLFFIKLYDSETVNYIVFGIGILTLVVSCIYFYFLFKMVKDILKIFHFRIKNKKELERLYKEKYAHVIKAIKSKEV